MKRMMMMMMILMKFQKKKVMSFTFLSISELSTVSLPLQTHGTNLKTRV